MLSIRLSYATKSPCRHVKQVPKDALNATIIAARRLESLDDHYLEQAVGVPQEGRNGLQKFKEILGVHLSHRQHNAILGIFTQFQSKNDQNVHTSWVHFLTSL